MEKTERLKKIIKAVPNAKDDFEKKYYTIEFNSTLVPRTLTKRLTLVPRTLTLMARTIYKRCEKDGKPISEGIEYWKKLSKEPEEFAEIRIVWDMDLKLD